MSIKPILFNTEMVRAILDGRKTVTRWVAKPQPHSIMRSVKTGAPFAISADGKWHKAPYRPGDILYVRETWTKLYYVDPDGYTHYDQPMYYYAADGEPDITLIDPDGFEEDDQRIRWRPSIHMPREAARIWLRVTGVRVERLQEIDGAGILSEGIDNGSSNPSMGKRYENMQRMAYEKLWDSTIKPADRERYGWAASPWVWVIGFERCEKPEDDNAEQLS